MDATTTLSRADLHCHSTASEVSKLGVSRALGLPECATPPEEVYELARRRGMDFVTITDHDTIDGALSIADRPGVFVSEELTARFRGEPQAVHILCWGITPDDHDWLQHHADDVEAIARYLHESGIACALAHPYFAVAAPLLPRHRRRLAQLFPVWETRNGARAPELNHPAALWVDTRGGVGVGGSDDHAGIDIGRTWTTTPPAATVEEFLDHLRAGRAAPGGEEGCSAKWAHAALAIAIRTFGGSGDDGPVSPPAVVSMIDRLLREADARRGAIGADLEPADARRLLHAWLGAVGIEARGRELIELLQSDDFHHRDLERRACRAHERRLRAATTTATTAAVSGEGLAAAAFGLFDACLPVVPYAPASVFLGRERAKVAARDPQAPPRVALVADGIAAVHGVTRTIEQVRERGVPGFEVEVLGTDAGVDRRLPAAVEVEVPFYPGLHVGVPTLPAIVEALASGGYDLVHVCSPGPAGLAAAVIARVLDLPLAGSHHTELSAYARLRSGDDRLGAGMSAALTALYGQARVVMSPSPAADASLAALGIDPARIARWDRGVDAARFTPERRVPGRFGEDRIAVLYAGRLTEEKGVRLLADAFELAHARDHRLHLVLAGGGPEEKSLRRRLGDRATFLGWLEGDALAGAYASSDVFLFPSATDTFGQVVVEAQASGLPVLAVDEGGPRSLVRDGVTGLLRPADAHALAAALTGLAGDPAGRARLAAAGLEAARERTWARALERLAAGWRSALEHEATAGAPVGAAA
jgi:glycosyltransferase involved in cell wall biosynthesis/predicted metal-dependent phosphoesterase TrpH